jgi:hypothetical protein
MNENTFDPGILLPFVFLITEKYRAPMGFRFIIDGKNLITSGLL